MESRLSVNVNGIISDAGSRAVEITKRRPRRSVKHVSRHFVDGSMIAADENHRHKRRRTRSAKDKAAEVDEPASPETPKQVLANRKMPRVSATSKASRHEVESTTTTETTPTDVKPVIPFTDTAVDADPEERSKLQQLLASAGIDELSSDSTLTDVPDDLSNPFDSDDPNRATTRRGDATKVVAIRVKKFKTKSKSVLTKSPYFPHPHKHRPTFLSTLPFPPLDQENFGLMQERLCREPFRLLVATIFLNKTPGSRAMPIFYKLMEQYSTPEDLAQAEQADVTEIIRQLGFQNQRARKIIALAKKWTENPPVKNRRYRKLGYPLKGDGKDIKEGEVIDDKDLRTGFEISHLPGVGEYSHDSWRMFCRDMIRGLAHGYNGEKALVDDGSFEPEWKRVIPKDKELRAWITWMWMKEGYVYNKETGERTKASDELMALALGKDNVVLESEASTLQVKSLREDVSSPQKLDMARESRVDVPAGDFLPSLN